MKPDLIIVPIEPLIERYTESWYRNLPKAFEAAGFNVTTIDGNPLQQTVKVGSFLDINSTVHYKMTQLQNLAARFDANKVKNGTVIFFSDIEFWGLESVRLMAQMNGVKVALAGFCHAASYTKEDAFEVAAQYQQYTEIGWLAALDLVMVGSNYHKQAIYKRRIEPLVANETSRQHLMDKIVVTGNPLFREDYAKTGVAKDGNMVLLTNRLDQEKRPLWTLKLFEMAKRSHPDWRFAITSGRNGLRSNSPEVLAQIHRLVMGEVIEVHSGVNKAKYHALLERASVSVSHSIEENFGYCIVEAALYGCAPMCPNGQSHVELVNRYSRLLVKDRSAQTADQGANLSADLAQLEWLMANPWYSKDVSSIAEPYFGVSEIMASHLLDLHSLHS